MSTLERHLDYVQRQSALAEYQAINTAKIFEYKGRAPPLVESGCKQKEVLAGERPAAPKRAAALTGGEMPDVD